jgi:hypothetical protein
LFFKNSKATGKVNDKLHRWIEREKGLRSRNRELGAQVKKLEEKVDTLSQSLKDRKYRKFPVTMQTEIQERWHNRHSRYTRVNVLLVSWSSDDMKPPLSRELHFLGEVCTGFYHYEVSNFEIPDEQPFRALSDRVRSFLDDDSPETLLIFYYTGHGTLQPPRNDLHWSA